MTDAELTALAERVSAEQSRRQRSRRCEVCGVEFEGRSDARFCSDKHRVAAHRMWRTVMTTLTEMPRWAIFGDDKAPYQRDGSRASVTDPTTWATAAELTGHGRLGFMLGDGIACIDLDGCVVDGVATDAARAFLERFSYSYVELSQSGRGLHIWGQADERKGKRWTTDDGLKVEWYSRERFMGFTGEVYLLGSLKPLPEPEELQ